jgi:hypothetical protein
MPRPKKSQGLPSWLIGFLLLLIAVAAYFSFQQSSSNNSLRTVEELDSNLYYENANSLRGNTYKVDVTIDSALGNSPTKGRLFSVILSKNDKGGGESILPVLVPVSLGNLTIQKGQHYLMKVKVVENGLLQVEEAQKP